MRRSRLATCAAQDFRRRKTERCGEGNDSFGNRGESISPARRQMDEELKMTTAWPQRTQRTQRKSNQADSAFAFTLCELCVLCGYFLLSSGAHAQTWPTKSLRVVVPFTAASATDTTARVVVERLSS